MKNKSLPRTEMLLGRKVARVLTEEERLKIAGGVYNPGTFQPSPDSDPCDDTL